jgi:hypothetical protein
MAMGLAVLRLDPPSDPDVLPQALGEPSTPTARFRGFRVRSGFLFSIENRENGYISGVFDPTGRAGLTIRSGFIPRPNLL